MIDHAIRDTGLGGSEIGALFNAHPFLDEFSVAMRKRSTERIYRPGPNDRQRFGKAIEPTTIALYEYMTGKRVERCDNTRRHPERPWQIATPDAFRAGEKRGIELKCCFPDQRGNWGHTIDEAPEYAVMQCWWYESIFDMDVWELVVMILGEPLPRIIEVHRDLERERVMIDYAAQWWRKFGPEGRELPPISGSQASAEWLKRMFPRNKYAIRRAEDAEVEKLEAYTQVRIEETRVAARKALLENEIKLAIRDDDGLFWEGGKFTYKRIRDSKKTDWKALAEMLMFTMPTEEREAKTAAFTVPVEGYRRVHFTADAFAEAKAELKDQEAA